MFSCIIAFYFNSFIFEHTVDALILGHKNTSLIVMEHAILLVLLATENVMEREFFVGPVNVYHKAQSLIIGNVTVSAFIYLNHVTILVMLKLSPVDLIVVSLIEINRGIMNVVNNACTTINLVMELVLLALLFVDRSDAFHHQILSGIVMVIVSQNYFPVMANVLRVGASVALTGAGKLNPGMSGMTVMASVPITLLRVMEYVRRVM